MPDLKEEGQPEYSEGDEQDPDERAVRFVLSESPLRNDHVGEENEVKGERGPVKGSRGKPLYGVGVSCHVCDTSGPIEVISSWQLWLFLMMTRVTMVALSVLHSSRLRTFALVVRVHEPGPCSGTSAVGNA